MNIPLVVYNKDGTLTNEFSNSLLPNSNFPLKIRIPSHELDSCMHDNLGCYLKNYDITRETKSNDDDEYVVLSVSKLHLDKLILQLYQNKIRFDLDYSQFRSNPCNLFIRNISDNVDEVSLKRFVEASCPHKSLTEITIIHNTDSKDLGNTSLNNATFAIAKFANHLDVDYLLDNKQLLEVVPNLFNSDPNVPLYINPYISKRERTLRKKTSSALSRSSVGSSTNFASNNSYDCVVLTDLDKFFGGKHFSLSEFEEFLNRFKLFELRIIDIYFPILQIDQDYFQVQTFGYITFDSTREHLDINFNVLMLIYYLQDLTYQEFMQFNDINLTKLNDPDMRKPVQCSNGLKIAINQAKFNSFLQQSQTSSLDIDENNEVRVQNYKFVDHLFRSLNFQETNIYVNNLPLVFKQDDSLWEKFWSHLGEFNLAKIIKPDFYKNSVHSHTKNSKGSSVGKIGFVFFKDFKTAIRAILLTNNKYLKFNGQTLHVQSSFAIQKVSGSNPRYNSNSSHGSNQSHTLNNKQYSYSNDAQSGSIPRNSPVGMYDASDRQNLQYMGPIPLMSSESLTLSNFTPLSDQSNSFPTPNPPNAGPYSGLPFFYYPMVPSSYFYYPLYSDNV